MKDAPDLCFELIRIETFDVRQPETGELLGEIVFGRCKCCDIPAAALTGWKRLRGQGSAESTMRGLLAPRLAEWWISRGGMLPEPPVNTMSDANGGSALIVTLGCRNHRPETPVG